MYDAEMTSTSGSLRGNDVREAAVRGVLSADVCSNNKPGLVNSLFSPPALGPESSLGRNWSDKCHCRRQVLARRPGQFFVAREAAAVAAFRATGQSVTGLSDGPGD